MELVLEALKADWDAFLRFAPRLVYAAIALLVIIFIGRQLGRLVAKLLTHSSRFTANERFLPKLTSWVVASIGVLLALSILGFKGIAASMLATGGVVAIVAGFAFREIGENLLAGFFLSFSRPFERGDLIQTGDLTGTVSGIELRHVHIRTPDACDVFVPSAQIFREPLYNYTRDGLRRPSFSIGISYDDDPVQVVPLLEQAVADVLDVLEDPKPFVTVHEFGAQYVEYRVFVYVDLAASRRSLTAVVNDAKARCWHALRGAGMTFSSDVSTAVDLRNVAE